MSGLADGGLRVLLASFIERHAWTGMGKWTLKIGQELEALGHSVTTWFADDFPRLKGGNRRAVMLYPPALCGVIVRDRRRFDVVVIHEPSAAAYALARRAALRLPPVVAMCHNVESKVFRALLEASGRGLAHVPISSRIKAPLARLWQADLGIRCADHVVCLSKEDEGYIASRLRRRPTGITRLTNGVDPTPALTRTDAPPARRVLFVGGWLDIKGRRVLPRLWRAVRTRVPEARLTTVGTGVDGGDVIADFSPEDRESVVVVPRLLNEGAIRAAYAEHDLLLMPSLSEGSPLVLLEAMAAGLPAVASKVGGIPDILTHGAEGLLYESLEPERGAEHVVQLLRDPALAADLGQRALTRTRTLTWTATARALSDALWHTAARRAGYVNQSRGA